MIKSFKSKALATFFTEGKTNKIQSHHAEKLGMILDMLNSANSPHDMNFPGSFFHQLKGDKKGYYSVRVDGNWRIIFSFSNSDAYEVDYLDYH